MNSTIHIVQNQWGGNSAPWNPGGAWVIGCRQGQNVVALKISSTDGGKTLNGTMTYAGEGPIGFRATMTQNNNYVVENQWGGNSAPWNPGGTWIIGCRVGQHVVDVNVTSADGGISLTGTMTYNGEGPIGFKSQQSAGGVYSAQNQWGGDSAPWHPGGEWIMGCRDQHVVAVSVSSKDGGKTLNGTMTYAGEGPIGFKASLYGSNNYVVENQWGGNSAPWHPGGTWVMGCRDGQNVVAVDISSADGGKTFKGNMTYAGEGPIGLNMTMVS
jgi:OAA-family lectin sugar binding domain